MVKSISWLRSCRPLRFLAWVTLPLFPLVCLFTMDLMNFGGQAAYVRQFAENFPGALTFELLLMALLSAVLLLACRHAAVAAGILGAVSLICSYVNFTKSALNGDNFMPQDILMLSHAGNLTSFISGSLPRAFWLLTAFLLAWIFFLAVVGIALPLKARYRLPAALLLILCAWFPCSNIDKADVLLNKFGMSVFDSALQSSNYDANGFVGAFTVNLLSLNVPEPEGYSRQRVEEFLSGYQSAPAAEDAEAFDVIVILSESFFDARILDGVTFSKNPLSNYDRLLKHKRCYSGSLYTTAIGGGTIRPEFGVLTGLTCDYIPSVPTPYRYISQDISTYVSNYRDAGYNTVAIHPYNKQFYSRDNAYGNIGFDRFYGQDEMTQMVYAEYKRGYVTDESTLRAIQKCVDESDRPTFLFAITMQNHQPYNGIDPSLMQVEVSSDRLSEPALTALTTYTQGLYDADQMLGSLAEWIDRRERPTVLVFFGDHMPTLGSNLLAYNESGLFHSWDGLTQEELLKMYATPFLVYSNRRLDGGLFEQNTGNTISDYNLLNAVAVSTGFSRTAYMNLLLDFYRATPIYNVRLGMDLTETTRPFANAMEYITYDRVFGENYSGQSVDTKGKR